MIPQRIAFRSLLAPALLCTLAVIARGDDPPPIEIAKISRETPVRFHDEIEPILRQSCVPCHNQQNAEADINLESPETMLPGADGVAAITPGDGASSRILQVASHQVEPIMPPEENEAGAKNLTPEQLGLIKLWIDQGAKGGPSSSDAPIKWRTIDDDLQPILAADMSLDGRLAACGRANRLFVYDVQSGALLQELTDPTLAESGVGPSAHRDFVQSIAFHPSGDMLATGGYETVKLWARPEMEADSRADIPFTESVIAISPDGSLVAMGTPGGAIHLWSSAAEAIVGALLGHTGGIVGLQFTSDGQRIVSCAADQTLRVWDVEKETELGKVSTPAAPLTFIVAGDDSHVVTTESDNTIRVWRVHHDENAIPTFAIENAIQGHEGAATSLALIDGADSQIVSGGADRTVRRWDMKTGEQLAVYEFAGSVERVAVSPNGAHIVAIGGDAPAMQWNVESGAAVTIDAERPTRRFQRSAAERQIALAKGEGAHFASTAKALTDQKTANEESVTKSVAANEAADKNLADLKQALGEIETTVESQKASLAAAAGVSSSIGEALLALKKQSQTENEPLDQIAQVVERSKELAKRSAEFGDVEASADAASEAVVALRNNRDAATLDLIAKLEAIQTAAQAATETAQKHLTELEKKVAEQTAALETASRAASVANANVEQARRELDRTVNALAAANASIQTQEHVVAKLEARTADWANATDTSGRRASAIAFTSDGERLILGMRNGDVVLCDVSSGAASDHFAEHRGALRAITSLSDGNMLSIDETGRVLRWPSNPRWRLAATISAATHPGAIVDRVAALDFSPDGKWLAAGSGEPSRSGVVSLWRVADGALQRTIADAHSDTALGLAFSPDSETLASSSADRLIKVFRTNGDFVRAFEGHAHHVQDVAWRANGRQLASGSADGTIKIWDFETGEQLRTIEGFGKEVTSVAYLGVGAEIVSSAGDGQLRIHNADNGAIVRAIPCLDDFLPAAAPDDAGARVLSGGVDGALQIWNAQDGAQLHRFDRESN